ncbi:MAG: hypothetical protein ACYC1P_13645, partial [Gaiellaceae bacterium]
EDTSLDEEARPSEGVAGVKLLVIWRDDERRAERVELARRFVALAERHGVLSVLEPVVRHDDREWAIVEAARELGATGCSLYKCQVPFEGCGEPAAITAGAREIDAVLPCPWVVLSQGVAADDFPGAVEASCKGGASGFLAGRALWTATLGADVPTELLREHSVPRLRELGAIVDAHGRPWRERP